MGKDNKTLSNSLKGFFTNLMRHREPDVKQESPQALEETAKLEPTLLLGSPKEIWTSILMQLHIDDIVNVNLVCKFLVNLSRELNLAEKKYPFYIKIMNGLENENVWSVWDNEIPKVLHLPDSMMKESKNVDKPKGWFKLALNYDEAMQIIAYRPKNTPDRFMSKPQPITQAEIVSYIETDSLKETTNDLYAAPSASLHK